MKFLEYLGWLFQPLHIVAQGNSGASEKTSSPVVKTASDTPFIPADLDLSFIKEEATLLKIQDMIRQINAIPKCAMPENEQNKNDERFFAYTLVDLVKLFLKLNILFLNVQMSSPSLENQAIKTIQERRENIKRAISIRLIPSADAKPTSSSVEEPSLFTSIDENGKTALAVLQENGLLSNPPMIVFPNGKVTVLDPPQEFSLLKPSTWFTNWGKRRCEFANEFNKKCALIPLLNISLVNNCSSEEKSMGESASILFDYKKIAEHSQKLKTHFQDLKKIFDRYEPSHLRALFGLLSGAKNTRQLIEFSRTAVIDEEKKQNENIKNLNAEITNRLNNVKDKLLTDFKEQCQNFSLDRPFVENESMFMSMGNIEKLNPDIFNQLNLEIANQSAALFVKKLDDCFDKKVNAFISTPNEKKLENLCNFCKQYGTEKQKAAIDFIILLLKGDVTSEPDDFRERLAHINQILSPENCKAWENKISNLFKIVQTCPTWLSNMFTTPEENDEIQKKVKVIILAFENAHFNTNNRILTLSNKQYPLTEWENLFQFVTRYCLENEKNQFSRHYHMTRALYFFNEMFLSGINDQLNNKTQMITALKESIKDLKPGETNIFSRMINIIKAKGGNILCVSANQTNQTDNQSDMTAAQLRSIISVLPKHLQSSLNSLDLALRQYGELKKIPEQILNQTLEDFKKGNFPVSQTDQEAQKKSLGIAHEFSKEYQSEMSTSYKNQYKQILLCVMIDNNSGVDRKDFAIQLLEQFGFNFNINSQQAFWSEFMSFSLLDLNKIDIIPKDIKACIDSVVTVHPNDDQLRKQHLILELLKKGLIQEAVYVLQAPAIGKLEGQVFAGIQKHLQGVLKIDTTQLKSNDTKSLVNAISSAKTMSVFYEIIKKIENSTETPGNALTFLSKEIMDNMSLFISSCFSKKSQCTPWDYRQSLLQNNTSNKISNSSLEFVRDDNDTVRQNNAPLSIRYNYVLFLKTTADVLMCEINNSNSNKETITRTYCFMKETLQKTCEQYKKNNGNREPTKKTFLDAMSTAINTLDILEKNISNRAGTPPSSRSSNTSPTGTPPTNGSNSSLASKPVAAEIPASSRSNNTSPTGAPTNGSVRKEEPKSTEPAKPEPSVAGPNSFACKLFNSVCSAAQGSYNSLPSFRK